MRLTCESCSTEHDLEPPEWVASSNRAFRFRCSECGHSQVVSAPEAPEVAPSEARSSIYLKQEGKVYLVQGWETLKQWIAESRIGPEDLISEGGVRWEHVSSRPEVADLFDELDTSAAEQDLPFSDESSSDIPVSPASEVFGGVPTGLPPLPVLEPQDVGTMSDASSQPDHPSEETIDDSFDEVERSEHQEVASPDQAADPLGEPGLTEDLVMESAGDSILFTRDEPEDLPDEQPESPTPEAEPNTLDDDELFKEFEAKGTAEPAPYAGDDWADEEEARSPVPWVVAALLTLAAIVAVVFLFLPTAPVNSPDEPDLSSALSQPQPSTPAAIDADSGADSDRDADSDLVAEPEGTGGEPDADTEPDSDATEPDTQAADPDTEAPVVAVPSPVSPSPVAPSPVAPPPAPAAPSVSSRIDAGWSKADGGDLSAAGAEFLAALRQRPGSADANLGYGYVLAEQGRASEARTYLCKARDNGAGSTAAEARGILTRLELTCD